MRLEKVPLLDPISSTKVANVGRQEPAKVEPISPMHSSFTGTRRKQIVPMIVGLLLCSSLSFVWNMWFLNHPYSYYDPFIRPLGGSPFLPAPISILFACIVALHVFFGAKFGPWTGCIVALGDLLGDYISGYLTAFSIRIGTFWYWYVILALIGFLSGLAYI
jgi:hypothetical protein